MEEVPVETVFSEIPKEKTTPCKSRTKGWTNKNIETITTWKNDLEERSFVYNDCAEWYENAVRFVFLLSEVLGLGIAFAAIVNVIIGSFQHPWAVVVLNAGMAAAAAVIASTNGVSGFYGWTENYDKYSKHSQRLYIMWLSLDSEMSVSKGQRFRAPVFIQRKLGEYSYLMQQGPQISMGDYNNASHKYKNSLYDETLWNLKFNKKKDNIESLV
jgi:hypothetical protein